MPPLLQDGPLLPPTVHVTPVLAESLATTADSPTVTGWLRFVVELLSNICVGAYGTKLVWMTGVTLTVDVADASAGTVFDAVDVAVTVTVLPKGIVSSAVYCVATPLAVWLGENDPQGVTPLLQLAVQSTPPELVISLLTVALKLAAVPAVIGVGNAGEKATEILGTRVIVADPLLLTSLIEVAITVTGLVVGMVAGAL